MKHSYGLAGKYKLTVLDGATREVVRETGWFDNLITDIGLDRLGVGAPGPYCRVGTGTTAPAVSDTDLVSQSASTSTVVTSNRSNAGAPDYESVGAQTFQFAQGAVVGNMAEIGVGWTASGASLFSRARILDGLGNPTTITVLSSEILQATYQLTIYPTLTDATGTVDISGDTYGFTARVADVDTVLVPYVTSAQFDYVYSNPSVYSGALGPITGFPSGTQTTISAGNFSAYSNGTHYKDYSISATISQGNVAGGIKTILVACGNAAGIGWTQIEFDPVIPKTSSSQFSMTMRVSWARH